MTIGTTETSIVATDQLLQHRTFVDALEQQPALTFAELWTLRQLADHQLLGGTSPTADQLAEAGWLKSWSVAALLDQLAELGWVSVDDAGRWSLTLEQVNR